MTFKDDVYKICKEVAGEFDGWEFASGGFKNKYLKHSDLFIQPGFGFKNGSTPLGPSVWVKNKKVSMLCTNIIGKWDIPTSSIIFQLIYKDLQYMPEPLRRGCRILQDKKFYLGVDSEKYDEKTTKVLEERAVDLTEARPVLFAMMKDGIATLERCYDLSSEESLLRSLPPKYELSHGYDDRMEMQNGVMVCIARILVGDFDFVEYYRSDDFKTGKPKRIAELDKLIAALPELKRRYAETGSAI